MLYQHVSGFLQFNLSAGFPYLVYSILLIMKNLLLQIVLLMCLGTLSAQIYEVQQTQNAIRSIDAIGTAPGKSAPMVRGFDNSYRGVLGTPYLSEEWEKGMLEQTNGNLFHDIYLRYNMVDDFIEIQRINGSTAILSKDQIVAFRIYSSEESFITFKVFQDPAIKKKGDPIFYAQVMNEGAIQLLIRRRKYFVPKANTVSPYHTNTNDSYKFKTEKYYIIFDGDETPIPLKRSKKAILGIMDEHRDEIEDFMKLNLLSVGNDHHLALIIDHYNELEEELANE